jgi:hypothetical protein
MNYRITIAVVMCDAEPVQFMAKVFGGRCRLLKQVTKSGRPIYMWSLYCRKAANALELLLPYLTVKRSRSINAIQLARSMRTRGNDRLAILSSSQLDARIKLASAIRAENYHSNGRIRSRMENPLCH